MISTTLSDGTEVEIKFTHSKNEDNKSAVTACTLSRVGSDALLSLGYAYCHPTDNFNKATGRKIALTRTINDFLFREDRRIIWTAYWNTVRRPGTRGVKTS